MKRSRMLLIVVALLLSICTTVYAVTPLSYWYSNTSQISEWDRRVDVYVYSLNSGFASDFDTIMGHAISQWDSAGIDTAKTSNDSYAEVEAWGGTYSEIKAIKPSFSSANTGLCVYASRYSYATYSYSGMPGVNISGYMYYSSSNAEVYVKEDSRTMDEYKKTAAHELGHALGWYGHSSNSSDVMYSGGSSNKDLTNRDKNHLVQIY